MSVNITGVLASSLQWTAVETEANTTSTNNTITDSGQIAYTFNLTSGTGDGQVNQLWHDIRVLDTGNTEEFDLQSLTQSVLNGTFTVSFDAVKGLEIKNESDSTIGVSMTGSNPFGEPLAFPTGIIPIPPSGSFKIPDNVKSGWTVDSSNAIFQVHDVDSSGAQYQIAVIGVSGV